MNENITVYMIDGLIAGHDSNMGHLDSYDVIRGQVGSIDVIKPNELYCKLFQLSFLSDQVLNREDQIFATGGAEWRRKR